MDLSGLMGLMDLNYKQVFNQLMKSNDAQSLMADFMNHCLLHCEETRECIIDILTQDERFKTVVEDSVGTAIENIIKKSDMVSNIKSNYFNK